MENAVVERSSTWGGFCARRRLDNWITILHGPGRSVEERRRSCCSPHRLEEAAYYQQGPATRTTRNGIVGG
jgi:hypothetical protein